MLASSVIKQHTDIQHPIKILELYSGKLELSLLVQVTTEQPCHWSESLFAVRMKDFYWCKKNHVQVFFG